MQKHVVTITTAQEISADQKAKALKIAEKALNTSAKEISLNCVVDAAVKGGIKITAGSTEFDATLRTKLEKITQHLRSINA